jgi:hypothetical protein
LNALVYLYGFVPEGTEPPAALAGVADGIVQLVDVPGARAVTSLAPAADYAADAIEARLADLDWVTAQGLAHEQVVAWFVDHADIAPAPLFTLYSSPDALHAAAAASRERIAAQLERCTGWREWNVKVACDAAMLRAGVASVSEPLQALEREIADAAPGRRFLLVRKRDELVKTEAQRVGRAAADGVLEALRPVAGEMVRLALPRAGGAAVLLHAAVLVPAGAEAELRRHFEAAVTPLEPIGIQAGLSGPWAPYRFMGGADG